MNELLKAGQHPDADQLNAFAEHTLPAHEQQQTLAHLAICPTCRQVVALALPPAALPAPVRNRWFSPARLVWVGVPALAALLVLAIFLRKTGPPTHTTTAPPQMADVRPPAPAPEPPPSTPPAAARRSVPRSAIQKQEATAVDRSSAVTSSSGAAVGILGGVGAAPATPQTQAFAPAGGPITTMVNGRTPSFQVATLLPSHLAILSLAAHANERVAIDTTHQLFFSDDNGRHWKAVPTPWKGQAIRVVPASAMAQRNGVLPFQMKSADAPLVASPTSGNLSGTVTDPTGATIQGATVAAIEFGSVISSATTDTSGKYRIENLPPGSYRVEAQAPGFPKQSSVIEIAPAHPATVNFTLPVGSMAQTVTVEAGPAPLDTVSEAPATPALEHFELTTDDGQRWLSDDGQSWKPE